MRKTALLLVFALLLSFCLWGCEQDSPQETTQGQQDSQQTEALEKGQLVLPQVAPDYFELMCQSCNVHALGGSFAVRNGARFHLISARPLTQEEIQIQVPGDAAVVATLVDDFYGYNDNPSEYFSEDIVLLYQGYTPEKVWQYNQGKLSREEQEEMLGVVKAFRELPEESVPDLYLYTLAIIPQDMEYYDVSEFTLTIGGVSKHYTLEGLTMTDEEYDYGAIPGNAPELQCDTFMFDLKYIEVNTDGCFGIDGIQFTANADCNLENIRYFENPEAQVQRAEITVTDQTGNTMTMQWDLQEPFALSKGDIAQIAVYVCDPATANKLWQNCNCVLLVDWKGTDGVVYTSPISIFFWQRLGTGYEYQAALDGYDMLGYRLIYGKAE